MKKYTEYTIECGDITDTITSITQEALLNHDTVPYEVASKLWLYKDGDECEQITGGWTYDCYSAAYTSVNDRTIAKTPTHLNLSVPTSMISCLCTVDKIPIQDYQYICVEYKASYVYQPAMFGLDGGILGASSTKTKVDEHYGSMGAVVTSEYKVSKRPISELAGKPNVPCYVTLMMRAGQFAMNGEITKIWLEP